MRCVDIRPLLSPALDEALSEADERRLREHLAECGACTRQLRRLRATQDMFRRAAPPRAAPRPVVRQRSPITPAAAAALGAAVMMLLMGLGTRSPETRRSQTAEDLVSLEIPQEQQDPPCYRVAECGLESMAPMP